MQLLMLFFFFLAMTVVSGIATYVVSRYMLLNSPSATLWVNSLTQVLSFALPVLVLVWRWHRDGWREYIRLDFGRHRWWLALVGVGVMLLFVPCIDWLTTWNDGWHWSGPWEAVERKLRAIGEQSQEMVVTILREGNPLQNLFGLALVPAICEELFFRAGVQNLLQSAFGRWRGLPASVGLHAAVWVTAALFSLAHGEVFAFAPRFLLGALLGYLYAGGGSLIVNMMVHFVNNAIVVVVYWLSVSGMADIDPEASAQLPWPVILAATTAGVCAFWFVFGKKMRNQQRS